MILLSLGAALSLTPHTGIISRMPYHQLSVNVSAMSITTAVVPPQMAGILILTQSLLYCHPPGW